MIQYEEHPAVDNGCNGDRAVDADPASAGSVGANDSDLSGSQDADTDYAQSLSTLIENEIIPRLMVAHATVTRPAAATCSKAVIDPKEIEAFAPLAMQVEADALLVQVEAILTRGVTIDTALVDLLAPTARLLAEFWEDERCDFVDVTMALWRLQEVVHELSRRLPARQRLAVGGRRPPAVPASGTEQDFGTVVDDIFRRDGRLGDRLGTAQGRQVATRGGRQLRHNRIDRKF